MYVYVNIILYTYSAKCKKIFTETNIITELPMSVKMVLCIKVSSFSFTLLLSLSHSASLILGNSSR